MAQFNPSCPSECVYQLSDPFKGELVDDFDAATGAVLIGSANQNLDATSLTVMIQCTSTDSMGAGAQTEVATVELLLWDKCR